MSVERKRKHVEVCLDDRVEYETRTTGFERWDLPYRALPETDLAHVDTRTRFLGRELAAPLLIGAMTGGAELSATINRNLAEAAERVGVGIMLGSQRVMLERPETRSSFDVRPFAPTALVLGNLGVAQLNAGYGRDELLMAVETIGADGIALHTNPLQEAIQPGGDTDFRNLFATLRELVPSVAFPVLLKEVGHGLAPEIVERAVGCGFAAIDVAGAGGTSWAKVEDLVAHGEVTQPDLVEWGIPTAEALQGAVAVARGTPIVASGGIRTGLDVAKAISMGAAVCAVARPLLRPAMASADAVVAVLERLVAELRIAMHGSGAGDLATLARRELHASS